MRPHAENPQRSFGGDYYGSPVASDTTGALAANSPWRGIADARFEVLVALSKQQQAGEDPVSKTYTVRERSSELLTQTEIEELRRTGRELVESALKFFRDERNSVSNGGSSTKPSATTASQQPK